MGDHNPAVCLFRREVGEFAGDIFVGEAVEAIPLDAPVMEGARDGEAAHQRIVRAVKGSVEGGALRQVRQHAADRADEAQALRLVERREHRQRIDGRDAFPVEASRPGEVVAAMYDAMPDGRDLAKIEMAAEDGDGLRQDAAQVRIRPCIQRDLDPLLPLAHPQGQRFVAEIDHAAGEPDGTARVKRKQADLYGGRAGIEGQQGLHAGNPSTG